MIPRDRLLYIMGHDDATLYAIAHRHEPRKTDTRLRRVDAGAIIPVNDQISNKTAPINHADFTKVDRTSTKNQFGADRNSEPETRIRIIYPSH